MKEFSGIPDDENIWKEQMKMEKSFAFMNTRKGGCVPGRERTARTIRL
jgi:hypothetical protein